MLFQNIYVILLLLFLLFEPSKTLILADSISHAPIVFNHNLLNLFPYPLVLALSRLWENPMCYTLSWLKGKMDYSVFKILCPFQSFLICFFVIHD